MDSALRRAPERDPAWLSRLFWIVALLVVLWPLAVATEFRPWVLLERDNLKISAQFIGSFWPLAHSGEFLAMVARDTWRTVAMATAGVTLALLLAIPLTLLSTRVLSVSALSGRMARGPFWLRQAVRWLLIVLRSIPELVWALVFVRVVGLGPHRRGTGHCADLRRHAGQGLWRNSGKR
jgi:phosphonate transport system permease protein